MTEERRTHPRIRAYRPVRLYQASSPVIETLTKDLGLGGMRCISAMLFPVTTELGVEVVLSDGEEPLRSRGKTAWFRTIPHSEQFDLGIIFLDVASKDKRRLSAYLDRISQHLTALPA